MALLQQAKNQQQGVPQSQQGNDAIMAATQQPMNAGQLGQSTEEATPQEQRNYERAMNVVAQLVYGKKKDMADSIADSIVADNKPGSLIQTGLIVIDKVGDAVEIDFVILPELIDDTVNLLADAASNKNGIEISPEEADAAKMGIFEAVISTVGGDSPMQEDFQELTEGMSPQEIEQMKQQYFSKLNSAKVKQETVVEGKSSQMNQAQAGGSPNGQIG